MRPPAAQKSEGSAAASKGVSRENEPIRFPLPRTTAAPLHKGHLFDTCLSAWGWQSHRADRSQREALFGKTLVQELEYYYGETMHTTPSPLMTRPCEPTATKMPTPYATPKRVLLTSVLSLILIFHVMPPSKLTNNLAICETLLSSTFLAAEFQEHSLHTPITRETEHTTMSMAYSLSHYAYASSSSTVALAVCTSNHPI
jgi:hypothetical protein